MRKRMQKGRYKAWQHDENTALFLINATDQSFCRSPPRPPTKRVCATKTLLLQKPAVRFQHDDLSKTIGCTTERGCLCLIVSKNQATIMLHDVQQLAVRNSPSFQQQFSHSVSASDHPGTSTSATKNRQAANSVFRLSAASTKRLKNGQGCQRSFAGGQRTKVQPCCLQRGVKSIPPSPCFFIAT